MMAEQVLVSGLRLTGEQVAWLAKHVEGRVDEPAWFPIPDSILRAVWNAIPAVQS